MFKSNNAALNGALAKYAKEKIYYVGIFEGNPITLTELNEHTNSGANDFVSPIDIRNIIQSDATRKPLLEMKTEDLNVRFTNKERMMVPLAADPIEFTHRDEGTPTFFVLYTVDPDSYVLDTYVNTRANGIPYMMLGTVGAVGSGADMELLDGSVIADRDYKANDIFINVQDS